MSTIQIAFVGKLVFDNPFLEEVFSEHINGGDGTVFPYLFLWEIADFFSKNTRAKEEIAKVLKSMDQYFDVNSDDDISNLIAVGFLESVVSLFQPDADFWDLMPSDMKKYSIAWRDQKFT